MVVNIKKLLKIFFILSKTSVRSMLSHRFSIITLLVGKLLRFFFYFIFLYFLLKKTNFLAGYNFNQASLFFLVFNFIDIISQMIYREVYRFRDQIVSGSLDYYLIKPYPIFLKILFGGFDILDLITLIPVLGLTIFFILQIPKLTLINLLLFIILFFNGLIISTAFHIYVLSLAILTTEIDHSIMIFRDLSRMGSISIDIYKEPMKTLLTFVLPIGIMITFPAKALLNLLETKLIIISFLISFLFLFFSLKLWSYTLKKYQSVGN